MTRNLFGAPAAMMKSVAVVARDPQAEVLDTVLDAGGYDVVFIESIAHAYSCIKTVMPDLVIVCTEIDDVESFQVLSMLKLDRETADIPVCTYVVRPDAADGDGARRSVHAVATQTCAASMN